MSLSAFAKKVAHYGVYNSLSQILIKITAPGVPDFYQGTELQDLTLVDPDNRRSVDYAERAQLLKAVQSQRSTGKRFSLDGLPAGGDGRLKLYLTAEALKARNMHLRLYRDGGYLALKTAGRFHNHVVAFVRHWNAEWSITAVPRFLTDLVGETEAPIGDGVWQDTVIVLPEGAPSRWKNIFTGESLTAENTLALGDALAAFPAALLIGE